MWKSSTRVLKSAPNIKWICVNFSSIHNKYRTELWVAATLGLWAGAVLVHSFNNYERIDGQLGMWIIEILLAFLFAAGFGWHLSKCVTLHRMEKRGKLYPSVEEFRTSKL
jgi:hypothetical protein